MILDSLPKSKLQSFIGEEILSKIEGIFEGLDSRIDDGLPMLYNKEPLKKVFLAFLNANHFKQKKFRRSLLENISELQIDDLLLHMGMERTGKFEEKIERVIAKGWKDYEFCKALLDWAELPDTFLPVEEKTIPGFEIYGMANIPFKTLKDYQFNVFIQAQRYLEIPRSRFVIQMPTGSGKTRTIMEVITQHFNVTTIEKPVVIWLAHSSELCEQAVQCFQEIWVHVANKSVHLYRFWGTEGRFPREQDIIGPTIVFCGFQKAYSKLKRDPKFYEYIRDNVSLIIVDEAHKIVAQTYDKTTKALLGKNTNLIGLTATPGRSVINDAENQRLSDTFFNRIAGIKDGSNNVIAFLRKRKVLSKVKNNPLITNINFELTIKEREHLEQYYDFSPGFLKRVGDETARNVLIIKRLEEFCKEQKSILFFSCSVEHSKFICSFLIYLGFKAAHVDGGTDKALRKNYIDLFRNGDIQVLCNYGVLSTGFDAPKTNVVFISRPTSSIVLYSQMIGRGLRGPAIGGTENCILVDVKDNIADYGDNERIYNYFSDYWI